MKKLVTLSLFVVLSIVVAACAPQATPEPTIEPTREPVDPTPVPTELMEELGTIVDVAVADGRFATMVTALQEAGLVETLQSDGPFTVFAPTDEAFAALPEGAIEGLLAHKEALANELLYHVVGGEFLATDVVGLDGQMVETASGESVRIAVMDGSVMVNDATVIITDIETSNGVIHVIDAVLLPETRTIAEIAAEEENLSTLVGALQQAGLVEALSGEDLLTVFAPTNDAFAALPAGALDSLLADTEDLTSVLLFHVVGGKVMAADVLELDGQEVETLSGDKIMIKIDGETVMIGDATAIITDIEAANGVIHIIDAVLLP